MKKKPLVLAKTDHPFFRSNDACKPVEILAQLDKADRLSRFREKWEYKPKPGELEGNCRNVAMALMTDLMMAGCFHGWTLVEGVNEDTNWEHCWLECDGWAVDGSSSALGGLCKKVVGIMIHDALDYRHRRVTKIQKVRDDLQFRDWIQSLASGKESDE